MSLRVGVREGLRVVFVYVAWVYVGCVCVIDWYG